RPSREHVPDQFQREDDRTDDHSPFDEDVVSPVFRERRVGFCHRAISLIGWPRHPPDTPPCADLTRVSIKPKILFGFAGWIAGSSPAMTRGWFIARAPMWSLPSNP